MKEYKDQKNEIMERTMSKMFYFKSMLTAMLLAVMCTTLLSCSDDERLDDGSNNTTDVAVTSNISKLGITYAYIEGYANLNLITSSYTNPQIGIELSMDEGFVAPHKVLSKELERNKFTVVIDTLSGQTKYYYRTFVKVNDLSYYGEKHTFTTKDFSNITTTGNVSELAFTTAKIKCEGDASSIDKENNYAIGIAYSTSKSMLHQDSAYASQNSHYSRDFNVEGCSLDSIIEKKTFEITLSHLQTGTTYYYCSFTRAGKRYKLGEVKSFTTKSEASYPNANKNSGKFVGLEFPHLHGGNSTVVTHATSTFGTTYSLEWDHDLKAQRWTCFYFTKENKVKKWSRSNWPNGDPFQKDPDIPADEQPSVTGEFSGSSYPDKGFTSFLRGHICASEDRVYSQEANEQTFYMSNMFPQGGNFNSGIWSKMEAFVRDDWGRKITYDDDTLFVVKGGTIDHESQILCRTRSGFIVPRYFFMALLLKRNGNYQAMAFWVEHLSDDHSNDKLADYVVNIRELEEKTCSYAGSNDGIDFFCNLPDSIEHSVETSDAATIKRLWNLDK